MGHIWNVPIKMPGGWSPGKQTGFNLWEIQKT